MSAPQKIATAPIIYQPPGPVAASFLSANNFIDGIMGPIGSGKTTTVVHRILRHAFEQHCNPLDGVARSRWVAIRQTYRQLTNTTIKTWTSVVNRYARPKTAANQFTGGNNDPALNVLRFRRPDGVVVELEILFLALGDQSIEDVLRGIEFTGAWLNEADRLGEDVITFLRGRVGRYPSEEAGGARWIGILLDYNAPDTENYLYVMMEEARPANVGFFRQPSGLSPLAENIHNLRPDYYGNQIAGAPDWYVRRMVKNEYGYSRDGLPVFGEFQDSFHVASQPLEIVKGRPVILGLDAGRTPAAIPMQEMPGGQIRIYPGLITAKDASCGADTFGRRLNSFLQEHCAGAREIVGAADPSAVHPSDAGEKSWVDVVKAVTGLDIRPAPTNALAARLEAVRQPLTRLIDGAPGLLLDPREKLVRKAFNSGYRFQRIQRLGATRYDDAPEKNEFSHPMDGVQYGALFLQGFAGLMGRRQEAAAKRSRRQEMVVGGDYDPFG